MTQKKDSYPIWCIQVSNRKAIRARFVGQNGMSLIHRRSWSYTTRRWRQWLLNHKKKNNNLSSIPFDNRPYNIFHFKENTDIALESHIFSLMVTVISTRKLVRNEKKSEAERYFSLRNSFYLQLMIVPLDCNYCWHFVYYFDSFLMWMDFPFRGTWVAERQCFWG